MSDKLFCKKDELIELCRDPTNSFPGLRSFLVLGFVTPSICLMGFLCSCANLRVFTNRKMRKTTINWFLIAISSSDLVVSIAAFSIVFLSGLFRFFPVWIGRYITVLSNLVLWIYPIGTVAQTATVWFTVGLSFFRMVAVKHPLHSRFLCTKRRAKLILFGTTVLAAVINFPRFMELSVQKRWSDDLKRVSSYATISQIEADPTYQKVSLLISYATLIFAIPSLLFVSTSVTTAYYVHQATKKREGLMSSNSATQVRTKNKWSEDKRTTVMLLTVVLSFLLCYTLRFVGNIYEISFKQGTMEFGFTNSWLVDLAKIAGLSCPAINTIIYYSFCRKYRTNFNLLCKSRLNVFRERLASHGMVIKTRMTITSDEGQAAQAIKLKSKLNKTNPRC